MVTLKEAWNSYILLLQSLKKVLPQKAVQHRWTAIFNVRP